MNDSIESQIAKHCDEVTKVCPDCNVALVEKSNAYGSWYECPHCNYDTAINDGGDCD